MSAQDTESDNTPGMGTAYAIFQSSKSLTAQHSALSEQARDLAAGRTRRWPQVVSHAMLGTAQYGSRTPFADLPSWVTLEVSTGGFATRALRAGGELTEYERELANSDHAESRAAGRRLPQRAASAEGARVFVGWSVEPHWLCS